MLRGEPGSKWSKLSQREGAELNGDLLVTQLAAE